MPCWYPAVDADEMGYDDDCEGLVMKKETLEDVKLTYFQHLEDMAEQGSAFSGFPREDKLRAICLYRVAFNEGWLMNEDEDKIKEDFYKLLHGEEEDET